MYIREAIGTAVPVHLGVMGARRSRVLRADPTQRQDGRSCQVYHHSHSPPPPHARHVVFPGGPVQLGQPTSPSVHFVHAQSSLPVPWQRGHSLLETSSRLASCTTVGAAARKGVGKDAGQEAALGLLLVVTAPPPAGPPPHHHHLQHEARPQIQRQRPGRRSSRLNGPVAGHQGSVKVRARKCLGRPCCSPPR